MTKIPFDIVGFDLDGTLVDSSHDLANSVNHALASIGLPAHSVAEIKRFVGKGVRVMLERALRASAAWSEARLAQLRPIFDAHYARHLHDHTRPYPGALAALEALRAAGCRLALCTNKTAQFALPLMAALDLERHFDAMICGDTLGPGVLKPDPAPLLAMAARAGGGRCVFLGDTSNDIDAARAAGMASIAVRFGFVDAADALGADAILDRYDALPSLLENWRT